MDDNEDGAESLAMLLDLCGHETHQAHDGTRALEAAERLRPDVVLLDIGLPGLNGYEVCRRIRQEPWGKDMVLVALTGWGQEEDRHRSREAGFNAHVVKPVDHDELMKLIAEAGHRKSHIANLRFPISDFRFRSLFPVPRSLFPVPVFVARFDESTCDTSTGENRCAKN